MRAIEVEVGRGEIREREDAGEGGGCGVGDQIRSLDAENARVAQRRDLGKAIAGVLVEGNDRARGSALRGAQVVGSPKSAVRPKSSNEREVRSRISRTIQLICTHLRRIHKRQRIRSIT